MLDLMTSAYINNLVNLIVASGLKYMAIHYTGVNADTSGASVTWYHKYILKWGADGYHRFLNITGEIEALESVRTTVNGMYNPPPYLMWKNPKGFREIRAIIPKCFQICFETANDQLRMNAIQEEILITLCRKLIEKYPEFKIGGHNEFPWQETLCPGFKVSDWLQKNNIPAKNIYALGV